MPFDRIPRSDWIASNDLAFAIRDAFPVSPGHSLVIAKRRVATWFEARQDEKVAILDLIDEVKRRLDSHLNPVPDGYNVGFNAGAAAGQTVMHLHVHVIPRYCGDMDDPRGGVRHVIPWMGQYGSAAISPLSTGGTDPFYQHIWPLFGRSTEVAILAAFVMNRGVEVIEHGLTASLLNGARVRLLTGDYLNVTQVEALERLLDWTERNSAIGLGSPSDRAVGTPWPEGAQAGTMEVRIVEVAKLAEDGKSFHPKSWRFEGTGFGTAFVGSSNLSEMALNSGIEWNLRVERGRDAVAYAAISQAFDALWAKALPLTAEWIADYAKRARMLMVPLPNGEAVDDGPISIPDPNGIQAQALEALAATRCGGKRRGLVVLATGLGKTWLAAFDIRQVLRDTRVFPKVLFLAHREELLSQAARTLRQMALFEGQDLKITWCAGERDDLSGHIVMAMVQKLSRPAILDRLAPHQFDYVVVDEVHHADAPSYRRILGRLEARFLLGLTATPERADQGDILSLFDDNLVFRADLGQGIRADLLSSFAYFGLKDTVDYANIPWRNYRFDPAALGKAVETQARMGRMWDAWNDNQGIRTLVFCCSVQHAVFVRDWLKAKGIRVEAVHSGPGSADRRTALEMLEKGELDAICSVDLFNEGVDVPLVDRVVMLRPTESPIVFLQQLGRGLRKALGKNRLIVIDFVGNHRSFLHKVRQLVSLSEKVIGLRAYLEGKEAPQLPPGCSVDVAVEAKADLLRLLGGGASEVERMYDELCEAQEVRPTAVDILNLGFVPSVLRGTYGSWFAFLLAKGHLSEAEGRAYEEGKAWFEELEVTSMAKSFKMVTLEALLDSGHLFEGMPIDVLARRSHAVLVRKPELIRDIQGIKELGDLTDPGTAKWQAYWRKNPLGNWAKGRWFAIDRDLFASRIPKPEEAAVRDAFESMARELVEYRLAQYERRRTEDDLGTSFQCKLINAGEGKAILKLPDRMRRPDIPTADVEVTLKDGPVWLFRFAKEFCNVAHPVGSQQNKLTDLMRSWFGPAAGRPGTNFWVRFSPQGSGWMIEPLGTGIVSFPAHRRVPAFPSFEAAASFEGPQSLDDHAEWLEVPVEGNLDGLFAVRAKGDSMDGGPAPIKDGEWLVIRVARSAPLSNWLDRVCLVEVPTAPGGSIRYLVKRLKQESHSFTLSSDNPSGGSRTAPSGSAVIGVLVMSLPADYKGTEQ